MPVHFIVVPDLPPEIKTFTLSCTYYRNDALSDRLAPNDTSEGAHAAP